MKIELGKKYRTVGGEPVEIYSVNGAGAYPVHGSIKGIIRAWTLEGYVSFTREDNSKNLVEITPYDDFNIDDKVLVWNNGGIKVRGYFADVDETGKVRTFPCGSTSWSSGWSPLETWDNCEKAE